jgi:hypothetical protein
VLYTLKLKSMVLLDVISIAMGFVLRAIAGVELIRPIEPHVEISPWLLVCTFFLALFLGFGKRRQEIVVHQARAGEQRAVLKQYSVERSTCSTRVRGDHAWPTRSTRSGRRRWPIGFGRASTPCRSWPTALPLLVDRAPAVQGEDPLRC